MKPIQILVLLFLGFVVTLLLSRRTRMREIQQEREMLPLPDRPDA